MCFDFRHTCPVSVKVFCFSSPLTHRSTTCHFRPDLECPWVKSLLALLRPSKRHRTRLPPLRSIVCGHSAVLPSTSQRSSIDIQHECTCGEPVGLRDVIYVGTNIVPLCDVQQIGRAFIILIFTLHRHTTQEMVSFMLFVLRLSSSE